MLILAGAAVLAVYILWAIMSTARPHQHRPRLFTAHEERQNETLHAYIEAQRQLISEGNPFPTTRQVYLRSWEIRGLHTEEEDNARHTTSHNG